MRRYFGRLVPVMKLPPKTYLAAYLGMLLILFSVVSTRPMRVSVPAMAGTSASAGLPLKTSALRSLLGSGFPSLGLADPTSEGLSAVAGRYLAAWLIEIVSPVSLGHPAKMLQGVFPALGSQSAARTLVRGTWPIVPKPATSPKVSGSTVVYGKNPRIILYATNGRDAFWPALSAAGKPHTGIPVSFDTSKNVLGVTARLGKILWKLGVPSVVSLAVNDKEGMIGAYLNSAKAVKALMAKYPSADILIDVDRAPQAVGLLSAQNQQMAKVYLVVGTSSRLPNAHWKQNMAFANALGAALQFVQPGLLAGVVPSPNRMNQELSPKAVTLQIGGIGSDLAAVDASVQPIAMALAEVAASAQASSGAAGAPAPVSSAPPAPTSGVGN